jgi:hypothetical protein
MATSNFCLLGALRWSPCVLGGIQDGEPTPVANKQLPPIHNEESLLLVCYESLLLVCYVLHTPTVLL